MSSIRLVADTQAIARYRTNHELAFERARQEVIGDADRMAPRATGRLAASITTDGPARRTSTGIVGAYGSAERHAAQREFGGFIAPVRKRALSWVMPSGIRIVLGPGIRRKFAKVDKETGQVVIFVPGAGVMQKPGGPRQGYRPYLRPAADRWVAYLTDHLRALSS